ncbi:Bax inhibitor-1/YccA family protein [Candidatus Poribacteria bacterium]|jgi:uncharacterized YccA/Bax inhibitor family protein|nr:Bax inhibitor-1/YccA family protein [Candidatus Poribacteria bacterium]MBT5712492.1 Bax inhibitor-1/YccA family protein [Candidatus Poribacteria bacterium]MBT7803862.1 Bax inhibitor-1/YccA family protein [Candidatus Poribacteria bacterium]
MRTANPALKASTFTRTTVVPESESMTIQGTVNKAFLILLVLVGAAYTTWGLTFQGRDVALPLMGLGLIGGLIVGIVTVVKHEWAPITAPIYGALQGFFLGGVSAVANMMYPGVVPQAVGLTFGTAFCLLLAYKSGLIKATENFKLGVAAATGGIFAVYMVSFIMGMFGASVPFIHSSGVIGIGFSLFVVVLAALNLVLDFDFIEQGAETHAPKHMEWYAAFGLMVTLIWLYLEILRLLMKLRSND